MKYELYTYCKTDPKYSEYSIAIGMAKRPCTATEKINIKCFENEETLFAYVRRYDYIMSNGKQGNRFLEAVMTNPNDSQRDKFGASNAKKKKALSGLIFGYLLKDEEGKVIDLRNYSDEVYNFDAVKYKSDIWKQIKNELEAKWKKCDDLWDKQHPRQAKARAFLGERVYNYNKYLWWLPYRYPRTWQERRFAAFPEYKPFTRGKRSYASLPCADDEIQFKLERSWKAQTKVKKQWLVNKETHIDTANIYK